MIEGLRHMTQTAREREHRDRGHRDRRGQPRAGYVGGQMR